MFEPQLVEARGVFFLEKMTSCRRVYLVRVTEQLKTAAYPDGFIGIHIILGKVSAFFTDHPPLEGVRRIVRTYLNRRETAPHPYNS